MAKSSTFNISVKLLTQQFNKGIKDIQRQIRGVGSFIKGAFALGSITAFGKQMIQTAMEFEDAMAKVRAVSNASDRELKMMTDEAKKLGETTRYTAIEAAGALENLTRNGMTASQATQALGGTLKFAQANSIGLAESADIVSNTLNMFGLTVSQTTDVTDVLSATASNSATNVSLLYEALVNAAPAAKVLGIGIEETSAAIGALAQRGVKGADAGTALRMALTKMVDPKIVAKMNSMGVAIDEQVIKQEGLLGVVKRLKDANLDLGQSVEIFSQRGAVGIQQLIGAYNELDLMLRITQNSSGTTARMFEQGVGSTRAAIDTLKSTYESFLLALGDKTSGVVNGVIKYMTDLIKNFKSVGGTIANLANVVIPLFTKMVVSSMTTFKTMMAQGAAAATAFKAAIGGWVTIIATAVTWFGTYLYTSLTKVNREIKQLTKELDNVDSETASLEVSARSLMSQLGPDSDKDTLAGVVKRLTELFPDFKEEIVSCAAAAGETNNYEKLESLLNSILRLQNTIRANKVIDDIITGYDDIVVNSLMKRAKNTNGTIESYLRKQLIQAYGNNGDAKKQADKALEYVFRTIATAIHEAKTDEEAKKLARAAVENIVVGLGDRINFNVKSIDSVVDYAKLQNASKMAVDYSKKRSENLKEELALETEIDRNKRMLLAKQKAQSYKIPFDDNTTLEELEAAIKKKEESINKSASDLDDATENAAKKAKKDAEKIDKLGEEYNKAIENAYDDLKQGYIDFSTYLDKCAEAAKHAYESFRDISGAGAVNPYKGERDIWTAAIKKNNQPAPEPLNNRVVNTKPDGLVGMNRQGPQESIDLTFLANIGLIKEWGEEFSNSIEAADTLAYSLQGLESAWDTLGSSSSSAIDKFSASISVMKNIASMTQGLVQILDILGVKELWEARIHEWATKKKLTDDSKSVVGSIAKAVVGAIASVVEIPVVGPILAVAAAAGILGLIAATVPKFASGGIISGGSAHGDRNIARVNSGEMILNKGQQRRLLDIANGASTGGGVGQVEFFISGKNLKGVLRNVDAANSRISGAAGL